jgi:hypothetical protein
VETDHVEHKLTHVKPAKYRSLLLVSQFSSKVIIGYIEMNSVAILQILLRDKFIKVMEIGEEMRKKRYYCNIQKALQAYMSRT